MSNYNASPGNREPGRGLEKPRWRWRLHPLSPGFVWTEKVPEAFVTEAARERRFRKHPQRKYTWLPWGELRRGEA